MGGYGAAANTEGLSVLYRSLTTPCDTPVAVEGSVSPSADIREGRRAQRRRDLDPLIPIQMFSQELRQAVKTA